jgi:cytochrome c oxidase assembly protein subunit 15
MGATPSTGLLARVRAYRVSPALARRVAFVALILLTFAVFTGAAVRLTGSGLACPNWPECNDQIINAKSPEWIEFGNRLFTGAVGWVAIVALIAMWRREPRERSLILIAALPVVGVLVEGLLGYFTVHSDLKPAIVISHFLLAFITLIGSSLLVWRAGHPKASRPAATDPVSTWAVRILFPIVSFLVVLGTFATGAGPHPGARATGEITPRIDWYGGDTLHKLILDHGHVGTATFVLTFFILVLLRWRGAPKALFNRVLAVWLVFGLQGVVGLIQYYNGLPAELVWIHIVLATAVWVLVLFAVFEAGRLAPRRSPVTGRSEAPGTSPA